MLVHKKLMSTALRVDATVGVAHKYRGVAFMYTIAATQAELGPVPKRSTVVRVYNRAMARLPVQLRIAIENTVGSAWKNPVVRWAIIGACVMIVLSFIGFAHGNVVVPWLKMKELYDGAVVAAGHSPTKSLIEGACDNRHSVCYQVAKCFWWFYNQSPDPSVFTNVLVSMRESVRSSNMLQELHGSNAATGFRVLGDLLTRLAGAMASAGEASGRAVAAAFQQGVSLAGSFNMSPGVFDAIRTKGLAGILETTGAAIATLGHKVIGMQTQWVMLFVNINNAQRMLLPTDSFFAQVDIKAQLESSVAKLVDEFLRRLKVLPSVRTRPGSGRPREERTPAGSVRSPVS